MHVARLDPVGILFPQRQLGGPEHVDHLTALPIEDPHGVDPSRLREHGLGGAVVGGQERHRPDLVMGSAVLLVAGQLHAKGYRVGRGVEHLDGGVTWSHPPTETEHYVLLVRGHEHIVDGAEHLDALDERVGVDVDHVDHRRKPPVGVDLDPRPGTVRPLGDARVDLPMLLVHRNLVGPRRQGNAGDVLERPRVEHVDRLVQLV